MEASVNTNAPNGSQKAKRRNPAGRLFVTVTPIAPHPQQRSSTFHMRLGDILPIKSRSSFLSSMLFFLLSIILSVLFTTCSVKKSYSYYF